MIREYPLDKDLAKKLKKKFPKNKKKGNKYPDLEVFADYKQHRSAIDIFQSRNLTVNLFTALCRGENIRTPKMDIKMKCQYLHYFNPYLRLGPFKMETKSHAPFVAIFRFVIFHVHMICKKKEKVFFVWNNYTEILKRKDDLQSTN